MAERFPNYFYAFGPFRMDPVRRLLLRDNKSVPLPPKAFELLLLLVENNGQVMEKTELLECLWPGSVVEEANLSQTIYLLRRALADGTEGQQYIETIPKRGYRFVAEVTGSREENKDADEEDAGKAILSNERTLKLPKAGETAAQSTRLPVNRRDTFPRWRNLTVYAVVAVLASLATLAFRLWFPPGTAGLVSGGTVHSLAVLPFKSLSPEDGANYLGLGMADVLITRLSSLNQIVVQPISAVRGYDRQDAHPLMAGRELKVDAVLDGTFQKLSGRLRVTLRLHDVRDGKTLWSGKFDESFTDIFKVQDSISEQIALALALNLTREKRSLAFKRYTDNSAAYERYLKGRYWWSKRTVVGLNKAIGYFDQAIAHAPDYALAFAGLADCYNLLSIMEAMPPQEAFLKARSAAFRALDLDNTLAEAHTSLGWIKFVYEWDWNGSEREFKQAIELSPGYSIAHDWYGVCLAQQGRFEDALAELKQAEQLDPISFVIQVHIGWLHYYAGRYDLAIDRYQKVLEMEPNYAWARMHLSQAYEQKGMYSEAIAELQKALALSTNSHRYLARLGRLYAVSGNRLEAQKLLNQLLEMEKERYVSPYSLALVYSGLNDRARALDWLRKGLDQRAGRMVRLQFDPRFSNLRSEPEFERILRRINPSVQAAVFSMSAVNSR